ncbi:hypothetical protein C8K63_12242 [Pseudomonas sp. GV085]|nr:hypothetical protein C8K63_12242 [Pseudomonas sp. GV085]
MSVRMLRKCSQTDQLLCLRKRHREQAHSYI